MAVLLLALGSAVAANPAAQGLFELDGNALAENAAGDDWQNIVGQALATPDANDPRPVATSFVGQFDDPDGAGPATAEGPATDNNYFTGGGSVRDQAVRRRSDQGRASARHHSIGETHTVKVTVEKNLGAGAGWVAAAGLNPTVNLAVSNGAVVANKVDNCASPGTAAPAGGATKPERRRDAMSRPLALLPLYLAGRSSSRPLR